MLTLTAKRKQYRQALRDAEYNGRKWVKRYILNWGPTEETRREAFLEYNREDVDTALRSAQVGDTLDVFIYEPGPHGDLWDNIQFTLTPVA